MPANAPGVLTIYNVGNALATVGGSLAGWAFLTAMGQTQEAFLMVFLLSSCCRVGALVLLARVTGVMDVVRQSMPVVMRLVSINPEQGAIDRPILSSMPSEERGPTAMAMPVVAAKPAGQAGIVVPTSTIATDAVAMGQVS